METLAAFAAKHAIGFELLSDEGSRTMERLGMLNEHVEEQQAFYDMPVLDRHTGIPYPGAFLLDPDGTVVDKEFEQSYRVRPSGQILLQDLTGEEAPRAVSAEARGANVQVAAWMDTATYRPYQKLRLHVAVRIDDGFHVYGSPIPEGYTPLRVSLVPMDGLVADRVSLPRPRPFRMQGLDERFRVYEGLLRTFIPFRIEEHRESVALRAHVGYQCCSDATCDPPAEHELRLTLRGIDALRD